MLRLRLNALSLVLAVVVTIPAALSAQSSIRGKWTTLGADNSRTAHNYTVLSYNNASVDSSSGNGLFSLTIREFHQNEKRQGEGSYVTVQGGMRGQYDTIVYQVMFDCPNQRFRKSGNEYFSGVRRLANQGEPPPLSDWQGSDQEGTTVMALRAFCRLRG